MKTFSPLRCASTLAAALLLGTLSAPAGQVTYEWNALSGGWTTPGNWKDGVVPVNSPIEGVVLLSNGSKLTPASTELSNTQGPINQLSVGQYNTLLISGAGTLSIRPGSVSKDPASFLNEGTISATNTSGQYMLDYQGTSSFTNTGTIEAKGVGGTFLINGSKGSDLVNTGGQMTVYAGSTLGLRTLSTGTSAIVGGTLTSAAGGTILVTESNATLRLRDITVSNSGTFRVQHGTVVTNDRITHAVLHGTTALTNATTGLVHILTDGSGTRDDAKSRATQIELLDTSSLTNQGTLRVESTTTATGIQMGLQSAEFKITSANATFSSTGTIEVFHNTTLANTLTRFSSVKSVTNQGKVHIRGNTNNTGASFVITGTGNSYTQSGSGVRSTVLENGGLLSAPIVSIASGSLGGVGQVTGATTIGIGASLNPGEVIPGTPGAGLLTFSGNLALANGAALNFHLGENTASSSQIALLGASSLTLGNGITLTLTLGESAELNTVYRLFSLDSGTITGTLSLENLIAPAGYTGVFLGGEGQSYLDFRLQAVPEPSTWLLGLSGMALLFWFQRRRPFMQT